MFCSNCWTQFTGMDIDLLKAVQSTIVPINFRGVNGIDAETTEATGYIRMVKKSRLQILSLIL